jgi:hypothetical protein
MMLNLKRFTIFSLKGLDAKDTMDGMGSYRLRHIESILKSKGYGYKVVQGSYKGVFETSVLVVCDTDEKLNYIRDVAFIDGQESILVVNEDRRAYLEYNKQDQTGLVKTAPEYIGDFRAITALDAKDLENWTLDGTDYYACI